ncbi:class I SAM-dependent methyltransferase [Roseateles cellulosilyticus]|uniref:Class I SAM-dependent methyltransferase n=1 Tax=Pelomonas cellulosilytica TaxID=2906762 RepID=A0ABS8XJ58_9BURK|nr:class I SAM-dependent methyltransferase [Pelomonas sp. P8]MCE4552896.1 class I SAM-dependent methyltransferase [Pelomonas sp. P8]
MLNTFQQAHHPMLPRATHDEAARQEFSKSLKQFVQQALLPGLQPVFEHRVAKDFEKTHGHAPKNRRDIRRAMEPDPYFQHYAALNRISQEAMWNSVIDSVERQLPELIDNARKFSASTEAKLRIDAGFVPPRYVTALDIHCMPGGYASEVTAEDVSVAALYDRGAYLYGMGFAGPLNDDMGRSVCNYVKRNLPDFKPRRILDMGCTVGHSTLPYKTLFPDAEVWGIDVGGPVVRYAHARAAALGVEVNFAQMNAEATDFEDGYFDLIVSHILLHETSGKAMPRIVRECHRLLSPGGYVIHADLPPFDLMSPFTQFILDNETWYNNEPFWGAMREIDQIKLAVDAGFPADSVKFATAPMAILESAAEGAAGYTNDSTSAVAEREFTAGEFAPGGGWEVLIARKGVQA